MIDNFKLYFKRALINYFENGTDLPSSSNYDTMISISEFILFKENMIKKNADMGEIIFDLAINNEYITPINNFANAVFAYNNIQNYDYCERNFVIANGDSSNNLKRNISIIHQIRNAFAHGQFNINGGIITLDDLHFNIPFCFIQTFNDACKNIFKTKAQDTNYPISITDVFFNDNCLLTESSRNLDRYLYTYMMLVCATNDMKEFSFINMTTIYSEPHFILMNHSYVQETEKVFDILNDSHDFSSQIDNLYDHLNESYYSSMQTNENNFHNNLSKKLNDKLKEEFRSIRNSIEHANVFAEFNKWVLFDTGNQNEDDAKNFEIRIDIKQLFNVMLAIDEGIYYDDKFAYLNNLFTISDRRFFAKIRSLEITFNLILENKHYYELELIESKMDYDDKFTIKEIMHIINNLYFRSDTSLTTDFMFQKLMEYSVRLFEEYKIMRDTVDDKYPSGDYFSDYDHFIQYLGLSCLFLKETLDLQGNVQMILDNHVRVAEDFSSVYCKQKN